jgi:hypothetical protein
VNVRVESYGGGGGGGGDDDDDGWGILMTCPPEPFGNPTSRDIWKRVGEMDEGVRILRNSRVFDVTMHL